MMGILSALNEAKGGLIAIAAIGGGLVTMDARHFPMDDGIEMQSSNRVATILELVEQAEHNGRQDWICNAIEKEVIQLCTEQPSHYLCADPAAMANLRARAGC